MHIPYRQQYNFCSSYLSVLLCMRSVAVQIKRMFSLHGMHNVYTLNGNVASLPSTCE